MVHNPIIPNLTVDLSTMNPSYCSYKFWLRSTVAVAYHCTLTIKYFMWVMTQVYPGTNQALLAYILFTYYLLFIINSPLPSLCVKAKICSLTTCLVGHFTQGFGCQLNELSLPFVILFGQNMSILSSPLFKPWLSRVIPTYNIYVYIYT